MSDLDMEKLNRNVNEAFRRIVESNPEMARLFTRNQASYRYFTDGHTQNRYFYTTQKINHKGNLRYVSGTYRYLKTKKQWIPVGLAGNAKKKDSIARADRIAKQQALRYV